MKLRKLGRTGLCVTPIGLGMAALGRPGYINLKHAEDLQQNYDVNAMEQHAHEVLDSAWEGGVRYFDAARSYGKAELFLGNWLRSRQISPGDVSVGSKWGYHYTADWQVSAQVHEVKQHSLEQLRRQRSESSETLGRYLGLYQIHSATRESGVLENPEVLAELARYRSNGLAIGLTLSGARQAETLYQAMEVVADGQPLFDCVQATWNILETSVGKALQAAHQSGMGVIIKEALANGRLTRRNDAPDFAQKLAILEETAAEQNTTVDAVALAAVLAQPFVDVALSGAATREQLVSNLSAVDVVWSKELDDRFVAFAEKPDDYWAKRSSLKWN